MDNIAWYRNAISMVLLLSVAACSMGTGDGQSEDEEEESPAIPVEAQKPIRGDIFAVYSGTASLEADGESEVVAKVGGEIVELLVEEGDNVKAGQSLAKLDGDILRLEMQQSLANLAKLEQEHNRNIDLHERGLISAGAFETTKYELDSLRAAANRSRLEYSYTNIVSPIDGVVADRFVKLGNTISVDDPVFRVTDLDPLLAYLHVPEKDFRKIVVGQVARVHFDALPDQAFESRVERISPTVSSDTGTFKVTIEITDDSGMLKPGMFGRFNIVYDERHGVLQAPRSAVVNSDIGRVIFVAEDGIAKRRRVETGYSNEGNIEILSGVADEDLVIVVGQIGLKTDARITVVNTETDAE